MPKSILVSVLLFGLAAIWALAQVVCAWAMVITGPHNHPLIGDVWVVGLTVVQLPFIVAAAVAGVTLLQGRFRRLTIVASAIAALIIPFGTVATLVTLTVARQHFPTWYKRPLRQVI